MVPLVSILYVRFSKIINVIGNSKESQIRMHACFSCSLRFFCSFRSVFTLHTKKSRKICRPMLFMRKITHTQIYFRPQNNRKRKTINFVLICAQCVDIKLFSILINYTWKENNLSKPDLEIVDTIYFIHVSNSKLTKGDRTKFKGILIKSANRTQIHMRYRTTVGSRSDNSHTWISRPIARSRVCVCSGVETKVFAIIFIGDLSAAFSFSSF